MNSYLYLLLLILLSMAPPYAAAQAISDSTAEDLYSNVSPSIAILITVLVSAFFVAGFFSLFLRNCSDDTADGANSLYTYTAAGTRTRRLSVSGLDPAAIESFPIFKYAEIKNLKIGRGALTCAVCVTEFEDDESLRLLPKCDHVFHPECIDAWLASHSTCPICRANLTEATEKTQSTEVRNSRSELSEVRNQSQISITVDGNQRVYPETSDREGVTKFPRSNSTGHSLVQLGEDRERYTLRLPEEVRRRVEGFDRVGRSDRRCLYMTPPFFSRTGSVTSAKVGVVDVEETAVGTSKLFLTSVESPFDCLASKSEEMSSRLPV